MTDMGQQTYYYCPDKGQENENCSHMVGLYALCDWCKNWHRIQRRTTWTVRNDGCSATAEVSR